MVGIVSTIIKKLNRWLNEKGQGIVEFALICAFCAGIGLFMRDSGFSKAINKSLEQSKPDLYTAEIGMKIEKSWLAYFKMWRHADADSIKNDKEYTNAERIKADQKALVKIGETYLGLSQGQVLDLMNKFSNSPNTNQAPYVNDLKCENSNGTGFSKGMLVPLSYKYDSQYDALWLDANNNMNTVTYLTDGLAEVYGKLDPNNPAYNTNTRKTLVMENLFYSDDMLNYTQQTVSLKLHYTDNKVDKIAIAVRNGTKDAKAETIGEGLCLLLTETGYTVVQQKTGKKDIVRETPSVYADIWNVGN